MQGNSGGGFGAAVAISRMSPSERAAACGLLIAGVITYVVIDSIDRNFRPPHVKAILANSVAKCPNAKTEPALYETEFRSMLENVGSMTSGDIKTKKDLTICLDHHVRRLYATFHSESLGTQYWGEYRAMGVLYTYPDGTRIYVIKPNSDMTTSPDDDPDPTLTPHRIIDALESIPSDAFKVKLANGVTAQIFYQQDGLRGNKDSNKNNDSWGWADRAQATAFQNRYDLTVTLPKSSADPHPVLSM